MKICQKNRFVNKLIAFLVNKFIQIYDIVHNITDRNKEITWYSGI